MQLIAALIGNRSTNTYALPHLQVRQQLSHALALGAADDVHSRGPRQATLCHALAHPALHCTRKGEGGQQAGWQAAQCGARSQCRHKPTSDSRQLISGIASPQLKQAQHPNHSPPPHPILRKLPTSRRAGVTCLGSRSALFTATMRRKPSGSGRSLPSSRALEERRSSGRMERSAARGSEPSKSAVGSVGTFA